MFIFKKEMINLFKLEEQIIKRRDIKEDLSLWTHCPNSCTAAVGPIRSQDPFLISDVGAECQGLWNISCCFPRPEPGGWMGSEVTRTCNKIHKRHLQAENW